MRTRSMSSGPAAGAVLAAAAGLVVLSAATAAAHPSWDPAEVQTGGPVAVELVVPHACAVDGGEPEDGDEVSPVTEVAMLITDTFTIEPQPIDGWGVLVEDGVAAWLADGPGSEGDLALPAIIEVEGEVGDVVPIDVYQECADGQFFRWWASEDDEGDLAVELTIVEGTPPPLPTPTAGPTDAPTAAPDDSLTEPAAGTTTPTPGPTEGVSPTPAASASAAVSPTASPEAAADAGTDDSSTPIWLFVLIGLAAAGAALYLRNRQSDPATGTGSAGVDGDGIDAP